MIFLALIIRMLTGWFPTPTSRLQSIRVRANGQLDMSPLGGSAIWLRGLRWLTLPWISGCGREGFALRQNFRGSHDAMKVRSCSALLRRDCQD